MIVDEKKLVKDCKNQKFNRREMRDDEKKLVKDYKNQKFNW